MRCTGSNCTWLEVPRSESRLRLPVRKSDCRHALDCWPRPRMPEHGTTAQRAPPTGAASRHGRVGWRVISRAQPGKPAGVSTTCWKRPLLWCALAVVAISVTRARSCNRSRSLLWARPNWGYAVALTCSPKASTPNWETRVQQHRYVALSRERRQAWSNAACGTGSGRLDCGLPRGNSHVTSAVLLEDANRTGNIPNTLSACKSSLAPCALWIRAPVCKSRSSDLQSRSN